ncbi:hypothetical protein BUALT_Bualt02G0204200 [Buddleja alternifolia]|uniref:NAC domain-containing protein n=1 Tax=Buddleja alternifolia TaxID=168488 RepID=A0AAV6YCM7_9LAMI|nr:hypothetical protein BUALT_Bualt02G0204200 [Buddleja alternifolia]
MGTKQSMKNVRNDRQENLSVPPGFVSLTSLTLKRTVTGGEASDPVAVAGKFKQGPIDRPLSNSDIEKFKSSFRQRPWILHDQSDRVTQKCGSEQIELDMKCPVNARLPEGVIRGCANCSNCVKVTARWHPEESCLPVLDDAPVFRPAEECYIEDMSQVKLPSWVAEVLRRIGILSVVVVRFVGLTVELTLMTHTTTVLRTTTSSYWKATGKDRSILDPRTRVMVGMGKTLVFYKNRAPNGIKTGWIMHEFRLENPHVPPKEDWVLCRVFHKSRSGVNKYNNFYDSTAVATSPNLAACHQNNITSFSHSPSHDQHQSGQYPRTSIGLSSAQLDPTDCLQLMNEPNLSISTKCEGDYGFLFGFENSNGGVPSNLDDMRFVDHVDHNHNSSVFI